MHILSLNEYDFPTFDVFIFYILVYIIVLYASVSPGGYSWEALLYGAFEFDDPSMPRWTVEYDPDGGILVFDGYILDSHYRLKGNSKKVKCIHIR